MKEGEKRRMKKGGGRKEEDFAYIQRKKSRAQMSNKNSPGEMTVSDFRRTSEREIFLA